MFPGQVLLSTGDIAKCLKVSKKHIYNLSYTKTLPVRVMEDCGGLKVSLVEMAHFFDSQLDQKPDKAESIPVPDLVVTKKRGRPRGSVSKRQMAFQSTLLLAIVNEEIALTFDNLLLAVKDLSPEHSLPDGTNREKANHKSEAENLIARSARNLFTSLRELRPNFVDPIKMPTLK